MKKKSIKDSFCYLFFIWTFTLSPFVLLLDSFSYISVNNLYLINISASLLMFIFYIKNIHKLIIKDNILSLFALLGLFIAIIVLVISGRDIYGYTEDGQLKSVFNYFLPFIIYSIGMLSLGRIINIELFQKRIIYLALLPCILILFLTKDFRVNYSLLKDPSLIGIYLYIGDALSIIFLIICFKNGFRKSSVLWFLFFSLILYLNNSRASFFIFIIAFFLALILFLRNLHFSKKIIYICFLSLTLIIATPYLLDFVSLNERMSNILIGKSDYSINEREALFNLGITDIQNNLFTGSLGGQVLAGERLGAYIHNIIEYYRQFSILSFSFILLSILLTLILSINYVIKHKNIISTINIVPILIFFSSLILILFARSIPYTYIFFSIGLMENILRNHNYKLS